MQADEQLGYRRIRPISFGLQFGIEEGQNRFARREERMRRSQTERPRETLVNIVSRSEGQCDLLTFCRSGAKHEAPLAD